MIQRSTRRVCRAKAWLIVIAAAGFIVPASAWAENLPEDLRAAAQTDHDRAVLKSLDLVLTLSLDRAQARAVLPIYERACRQRLEAYNRQAEVLPKEIEAYAAFLAEDRLNQGFSPEVERRTGRIHHDAKVARESAAEQLNALADEVYEILTPAQRQLVDTYEPGYRAVYERFATKKDRRKLARQARWLRRRAPHLLPRLQDPRLTAAKQKVDAINKAIHPREENIAKLLLAPSAAEALHELAARRPTKVVQQAFHCWRFGTEDYPLAQLERDRQTVRELSKQINNWNLANGMYFDADQIERLVYLADQAERLKAAQREARPRDQLPRDVFNAQLVRVELAAEQVLRPGQRDVLETYKPCLLPPKDLKNPVRAGQASDSSRMAKWLERARGQNDRRVSRMIDRVINGEIAHLGPMDDDENEQRRAALREAVQTASHMNDVDFALNKDGLAASIQPRDRKQELVGAIDDMRRDRAMPGKTFQSLLNPDFAAVLMERHWQLANGVPIRGTDKWVEQ